MIRKRLYAVVLTVILVTTFIASASAANEKGPSDILLSWTGDTSTTATVSWHSAPSADAGKLFYGTDPSLTETTGITAISSAPASGIKLDYTIWQAVMTGLKPGTTYYYAVQNGDIRSNISTLVTGEDNASAFTFIYMGDIHMGVGSDNVWGSLLDGAYARNPSAAFGIFGGDVVDSGISSGEWQDLLDRSSPVFSKIPLMPANGNHESNFPDGKPNLYLDLFSLPQNGPEGFKEEFYSFDYGNTHITVLNSWVFSGEQKLTADDYQRINNWITEDLASSHATWKIVVMHHPVYTLASDKVADAVRKNWAPLFEKGGVSLILCGHQHVYSRSYPMLNGQIDYTDGITSVMGNASQKFYTSADETYQAKTVYSESNYQIVRVDGDNMTVQSYDTDGNMLDFVSLKPRSTVDVQSVFSDVSNDSWYAPAANYSAARGIMVGTSGSTFSPEVPITRAMIAALLYRLAGVPATASQTVFTDVPKGVWYASAASWLSETKIMSDTDGGLFDPNAPLTREQLADVLFRYAQYENRTASITTDLTGFSDAALVSPWASEGLSWAVEQMLITGSGGLLDPQGTVTRAQCAQIIKRLCLAYAL